MLDFIRKTQLWEALDSGYLEAVGGPENFDLLAAQNVVMAHLLSGVSESRVAEVSGGNSLDVLSGLTFYNDCSVIGKFDGKYGGPKTKPKLDGVGVIDARVGELDNELPDNTYNLIYSVSLVEHLAEHEILNFFRDCSRILKPGGSMLHAVDFYLPEQCSPAELARFEVYRNLSEQIDELEPLGDIYKGEPKFSPNMVTNPDHVLYGWGRFSKAMIPFRARSQLVSLIIGFRKVR